jgi:hypothetical protein
VIDPPHFGDTVVGLSHLLAGISKLASSIFGNCMALVVFLALSALAKTAHKRTVGVEPVLVKVLLKTSADLRTT